MIEKMGRTLPHQMTDEDWDVLFFIYSRINDSKPETMDRLYGLQHGDRADAEIMLARTPEPTSPIM